MLAPAWFRIPAIMGLQWVSWAPETRGQGRGRGRVRLEGRPLVLLPRQLPLGSAHLWEPAGR